MKIVIKAVDRPNGDRIGTYLFECLQGAATDLDIELIRLPTEKFYTPGRELKVASHLETEWVNKTDIEPIPARNVGIMENGGFQGKKQMPN